MKTAKAVARRPRAGHENRRAELVTAAFRLIARNGFEGLRTRDIAAEAGVNVATLHYYFPTKESLIRGVLDFAMQRFRSTLEPHGSPSDQLRNHLRAVRKLMLDEPGLGTVMGELSLRSHRDPSVDQMLEAMFDAWVTTIRGLLRRAAREGGIRPELDSEAVASLIIVIEMGLTLPPITGSAISDQAAKQLEKWLGLAGSKRRPE